MWIMDAPIQKGAHKLLLLITKVPVAHNIYSLPSHVSQSRDGSGMEIKEKLTPQVPDSAETERDKKTPQREGSKRTCYFRSSSLLFFLAQTSLLPTNTHLIILFNTQS